MMHVENFYIFRIIFHLSNILTLFFGCVPLPEWTGMDYRNGHYAMALCALNVFYLHKMYFCNSLHNIKLISV